VTELSPARQALLEQAIDVQERLLDGCTKIFSGLRQSSDPEVVLVSEEALKHLQNAHYILDAMIDGLNATYH
jgi:hypothetical protein